MEYTLFKYRAIGENTEKIFSEQKVWLSNAKGLNDPFECSIQDIAGEFIREKVVEMKNAHIMGFVHSSAYTTDSRLKGVLRKIRKTESIDAKHEIVRKFLKKHAKNTLTVPEQLFKNFDKQLNEAGIFSLSEDPLNELMWAHYGDEHKGIVIGFGINENSEIFKEEKILKVNYSDELPEFSQDGFLNEIEFIQGGKNRQKIGFKDKSLQSAISTKSLAWSYEKEWRYVEPKKGLFPFPGPIVKIVFGLRMELKNKLKYRNLASKLECSEVIKFYQIEKENNTNKIIMVEVKK